MMEVNKLVNQTDITALVDQRTVNINRELPKSERLVDYVKQIKNPYHYKCGTVTISAYFPDEAPSFEECMQNLMN
jgi:hypothetical protein